MRTPARHGRAPKRADAMEILVTIGTPGHQMNPEQYAACTIVYRLLLASRLHQTLSYEGPMTKKARPKLGHDLREPIRYRITHDKML